MYGERTSLKLHGPEQARIPSTAFWTTLSGFESLPPSQSPSFTAAIT